MVLSPRIRSEDVDAYKAGRLDEIKPDILDEVKALVARQSPKGPFELKADIADLADEGEKE